MTRPETAADARARAAAERAYAAGQDSLARGDHTGALRWLDRASRLAPAAQAIRLAFATACLAAGDPRARPLLEALAAASPGPPVREVWMALAAARLLAGDPSAAAAALGHILSRCALAPGADAAADRIARAAGAPGWCAIRAGGLVLGLAAPDGEPPVVHHDGVPWRGALPATGLLGVTHRGAALLGSPIDLAAIALLEGEADRGTGWAWHPGDPDRDPVLTIAGADGRTRSLTASAPAGNAAGLLARPRAFRAGAADRVCSLVPPPAPAAPPRPDRAAWLARPDTPAVLLVTHDQGGGVARSVRDEAARLAAAGERALILRPGPEGARLSDGTRTPLDIPGGMAALLGVLRAQRVGRVVLHHLLGHDPAVADIPRRLGVPYEVRVHDYGWFCPRLSLLGPDRRYCGEPDAAGCASCLSGGAFEPPDRLRARSAALLRRAARVTAPSHDAARRMMRQFSGLTVDAVPPAAATPPASPAGRIGGMRRICVPGAIGPEKGFDVLLACARDAAARGLPLGFVVAGHTVGDEALFATGRVFVTGPYEPDEAPGLIRAQRAALAFLPSIVPETWCHTLSDAWEAGLAAIAFDLGAPAERIRAEGGGRLLPLALPPAAINDALLDATH